uniref:Uncharacterized protein n=1 Tax=viral metagenome TaxID=1070528 RepID=A0A6C0DJ70_9ZZZZ
MAPCDGKVQKHEKFHESTLFSLIIGHNKLVSPKIKFMISDKGHTLTMSNIEESKMGKLQFPVNNDSNNNKLTLVNVSVCEKTNPSNVFFVPGLDDILAQVFNSSNSQNFGDGKITHVPFDKVLHGSGIKEDLSVPQLADILTGLTIFTQPSSNVEKLFTITLSNACIAGCSAPDCNCDGAECAAPYSGSCT